MLPDLHRPPRTSRPRRAGFSLIELLIVIAIILIILAVALPKLTKARTYAQEMAAVKAITTFIRRETQYYSQYGQYATSLAQLGPPTSGAPGPNGAELIDRDLATGEKGGFKFVLQPSQTGYSLVATPAQFGTSGTHTVFFRPEHVDPRAQRPGTRDGERSSAWARPQQNSNSHRSNRMIPRPLNMEQLVRCLERQFGPVTLFPDEGYTKLRVGGVALTFLEAERFASAKLRSKVCRPSDWREFGTQAESAGDVSGSRDSGECACFVGGTSRGGVRSLPAGRMGRGSGYDGHGYRSLLVAGGTARFAG